MLISSINPLRIGMLRYGSLISSNLTSPTHAKSVGFFGCQAIDVLLCSETKGDPHI
jgi:hypothetical protein